MPLVLSKEEWAHLSRWMQPSQEEIDATKRREFIQKLDEASKLMTKTWPNSLENVSKRNEEVRRARIEAAEAANTNFYKKYVRHQQQEQERLMYSARDTIFKNKDAPKFLLGAVMETAIQKERQVQLEFLNERRREEMEEKRQDDLNILNGAKDWHELMQTKRQRRFDVNKKHQQDLLDQAHEISEKQRKEYEEELNMQKIDNMKADAQMEQIKEFEQNFKEAERARIWADVKQSRDELEARRREQRALEDMDDKLIAVLNNSKNRVEKMRKKTEADTKAERRRVLELISQKLETGDAAREAKDQAIYEKAVREKEAADEARRQADERKREKIRNERIESRKKFLKDEAQKLHEKETMMNWSVMNRFKNEELYDDYKEDLRLKRERKIKEYKEDIIKLWRERDERSARARAELRDFYGPSAERKLRDADNKLLTHAAALLDEARRHGRPTLPLHRAIDQYCKLYRLYPMPDLPKSMQEHFRKYAPKDGSKPDPNYREPPPPIIDSPREPAFGHGHTVEYGKTDGLQGTDKPNDVPQTSVDVTPVAEYKRRGRADGLQRKSSQQDVNLPPITVKPCTNKDCNCELRQ